MNSALVSLLRCPSDGSALKTFGKHLSCPVCLGSYPILDGIVRLLDAGLLGPEEQHEIRYRNEICRKMSLAEEELWEDSNTSRMEVPQHLAALKLDPNLTVLEVACGKGRLTTRILPKCKAILAVDFSLESLRFLAKRLRSHEDNVLLVHADITRFRVTPGSIDRVLSTTPLDSREQRLAMHRLASEALREDGRYVFSTEYYDLRSRWHRLPQTQRYPRNGSLFFRFKQRQAECEALPYFERVCSRPIQVFTPFRRSIALGRIFEYVPLLREFGNELLVRARHPVREMAGE